MNEVRNVGFARSYDAEQFTVEISAFETWHDQLNVRSRERGRVTYAALQA
jgi:hypothetical protein